MTLIAGVVCCLVLFTAAAGAAPIKDILVEDNLKTTDDTVILIAGIRVGDDFDPGMVPQIRNDLVGSGLFKDVEVIYEEIPGGYKVIISARDKHSWVVAPAYYNQPTNKGGGVGYGENNLFGENKKLFFYGQLATGDSFLVGAYVDPSISHTRFKWQTDVYLLRKRVIEYRPPTDYFDELKEVRTTKLNYLNAGLKVGVNLFRGASLDVRVRGAKVSYTDTALAEGAVVSDVTLDPNATPDNIPDPGVAGYDVSAEVSVQYDRRANWYGITHGDRYRLNYERGLPDLGSDFDYWYVTFRFDRARKYFAKHNLILKSVIGYGRHMPFQQELTAGGTDLRGFKNAQYRGDVKLAANIEYSLPLFEIKGVGLRALGFWDTTYTAFLNADPATDTTRNYLPGQTDSPILAPFKNTVGGGIRLNVRQIVLPLLGLDIGYGIERKAYEIYLAIGLTDV